MIPESAVIADTSTASQPVKGRIHVPEILLALAICLFFFFYGLGNFGLVGADEPRYAQVAREMLERKDLITPTLNGEPWLEKPALYYWRAMLSFETFGVRDWAARMPSATFGLLMILIIYFHMRRFRPGAQLDAALITASCAAIIGFARGASTDMQLAAPFTVAMLGWYAWYETGSKFWLFDLYFFLAVATLAKGPVALFLAGIVVLIFAALRRDIKTALRTLWLPGIVLYSLIVLPWFIAVQWRNPQFLRVFILEHNLARFGTETFHHMQPFWYYAPVLLLALAPWTFFAIPALYDALRSCLKDWRTPKATERANMDSFPEFLVLWALIPIVFFSISKSKLPGYILPAIAPCTILTADFLQRKRKQRLSELVISSHAALSSLIVALFLVFPYFLSRGQRITPQGGLLVAAMAAVFFSGIYFTLHKTGVRLLRFVTLVPVIVVVTVILRIAAPSIDNFYSARPVARELERMGTNDAPVAVFNARRELRYGLSFYRDQKIGNYNEGEVPATGHLLITTSGSHGALTGLLNGRRLSLLGEFKPQHLEYYWVSGPEPAPAPAGLTK